eukprot:1136661-Pelagomonas_calceolata.AAC.2
MSAAPDVESRGSCTPTFAGCEIETNIPVRRSDSLLRRAPAPQFAYMRAAWAARRGCARTPSTQNGPRLIEKAVRLGMGEVDGDVQLKMYPKHHEK